MGFLPNSQLQEYASVTETQLQGTRELSVKSSKIEYIYPQFCISLVVLIRLETLPPDMTTKLQ
jgi:hypothetical protein